MEVISLRRVFTFNSNFYLGSWVGWPGIHLEPTESIPESDPTDTSLTAGLKSKQFIPVDLGDDEYEVRFFKITRNNLNLFTQPFF